MPVPFALVCFIWLLLLLLLAANGRRNEVQGLDIEKCVRALGMESGRIRDEQLSASSTFDPLSTGPVQARLNTESGSGAWCPLVQINATSHEWIQVELREDVLITGVRTQGRWDKGRGLEYPSAYMLEYWRESLGRWARYKNGNGNEIIQGNSNTQSAVLRLLDGGILANLIRLIPVSESTRTVCLRFELYGCPFKEPLASYSAPSGAVIDQLDMRDQSYDGTTTMPMQNQSNGESLFWLHGGIGQLFDGAVGQDNFEEHPIGWMGWHRSQQLGPFIPLEFVFSRHQNLSALLFHTSNFRRRGAALFHTIRMQFAPFGGKYSQRIVQWEVPEDDKFENVRWVRVPIPHRVASHIRVEISFDAGADWLLLSEVRFESQDIASVDMSERLWRHHLLEVVINTSSSSTIMHTNDDDGDEPELANGNNNGNGSSWPNADCLLLIVLISTLICCSSVLLCLCLCLIIRRQNHRTPLKMIATTTAHSCGDSFHSDELICSSSSAHSHTNSPYSSLHHSKSLLIQQFVQGVKRRMESKKDCSSPRASNLLLKKAAMELDDAENQKELMDIAQLVIRQHHSRTRGTTKGAIGNNERGGGGGNGIESNDDDDDDEYADPDEQTMFAGIRPRQMPALGVTLPARFAHLHYATTREMLAHNSRRPENLPSEFFVHSDPSCCGTINSSSYRYRATPTLANLPPNFPPPPLPPVPPPQRSER